MAENDPIRIIPHRGVDGDCGSLEVWLADGRKSVRFYWDNQVSRRLDPNTRVDHALPVYPNKRTFSEPRLTSQKGMSRSGGRWGP
jgi:hypothetical protein